jgi:hypothetical protein
LIKKSCLRVAYIGIYFILFNSLNNVFAFQIPAFPGAEGYGAISVGGRGGKIIEVTNLNNDGPGSFREACAAKGARIVVFKVAGEIIIPGDKEIEISNSNITIAGQTAPGDGITIRATSPNDGPLIEIVGASDVIIRYLKLRLGRGPENGDNITIRNGERIIIDHISAEWGSDESISCTPNSDGYQVRDVSVQRCIIAETLEPHSMGSTNSRYGETDQIVDRVSYHYNLWAHNNHRNPRIASHIDALSGIVSQIINNVVYNWQHRISETKGRARTDFYGNYYKLGPMSNQKNRVLHEQLDGPGEAELPDPSIYADSCIIDNGISPPFVVKWDLLQMAYNGAGFSAGDPLPVGWQRNKMHSDINAAVFPVTLRSGPEAYNQLVIEQDVGCNGRLDGNGNFIKNIDKIDSDIFTHVVNRTGPALESELDHEDDFGGYPVINTGTAYTDSDHDGMPDAWERSKGLNPDSDDSAAFDINLNYTNIEVYINTLSETDNIPPQIPQNIIISN